MVNLKHTRSCPSNLRRQPIILTDAEKERIDREREVLTIMHKIWF